VSEAVIDPIVAARIRTFNALQRLLGKGDAEIMLSALHWIAPRRHRLREAVALVEADQRAEDAGDVDRLIWCSTLDAIKHAMLLRDEEFDTLMRCSGGVTFDTLAQIACVLRDGITPPVVVIPETT
jgi:hypothetical protein